jgi:hypothetical protein
VLYFKIKNKEEKMEILIKIIDKFVDRSHFSTGEIALRFVVFLFLYLPLTLLLGFVLGGMISIIPWGIIALITRSYSFWVPITAGVGTAAVGIIYVWGIVWAH